MSYWAVFRTEPGEPLHAAPCSDDGDLLDGHELTEHCECKPERLKNGLWVHNDPERGGCDA